MSCWTTNHAEPRGYRGQLRALAGGGPSLAVQVRAFLGRIMAVLKGDW